MTGREGPGPNDRSARPGSCASVAPTVALQLQREILPGQHRRRLIRVKLVPRLRADRHDLPEVQFRIDGHLAE
jgi:hypothetical protein